MKTKVMKRYIVIILALIFILGAILRLYNIGEKSLWFDEASNITSAMKSRSFILQPPYNYKPLYLLLLRAWIGIFGISALTSRLLTALLGIFSAFLVFSIGKSLFNIEVGLISSFFLSISVFHIFHSQQVGPETFLLFLALLSFYSFIKFLKKRKTNYLIINLILNILIIYTYPIGFLIILSQLFYIISNYGLLKKSELKKWLVSQSVLVLLLGLLLVIVFTEKQYFKSVLWWARPPLMTHLIETFKTFSYAGPRYGLEDVSIETCPLVIAYILNFVFATLFITGLFKIIKNKDLFNIKGLGNLVIIWLFLPLISAFLFSYIFFPVYFIRKLLFCLPAFYLIVSVGAYFDNKLFSMLILVSIFSLSIAPLKIMYNKDPNVDWNKVVLLIRQRDMKDDAIIVISTCKEVVPFMYYFSDSNKKDLKDISMFGKFKDGKWQETFRYKKHHIITIASEHCQPKDIELGRNFNHNVYSCNYIISDFDKKVFQEDILNTNKQIWVLMSRWTGVQDECLQMIIDKFKRHLKLKLEDGVGGVKVFCFESFGWKES